MALPPSIPTSFVPHSPGTRQKFRSDFMSAFGVFAYAMLGLVFLIALGVFLYGRILNSNLATKNAELASVTESINQETVEGFVRLRNRLNQGQALLDKHVALSNFFAALENILPASVRFTDLHLSLDSTNIAKVEGAGTAKNFNALAALSAAFAADGRIKDAIFSKISINKDNSVSFNLSASLDPKLIVFSPSDSAARAAPPPQSEPAQAQTPALPEVPQGAAPTL